MSINPNQSKRGEQLNALRKLQLPSWPGVSAGSAKAVLRAVDGYGAQCWASATTLANETQFNERTVRRALANLVEGGYLSAVMREGQTNAYSIQWDRLTPDTMSGVQQNNPGHHVHPPQTPCPGTQDTMSGTPDTMSDETKRNVIETKKKRNSSSLRFSDEDLKFAELMFEKIVQVAPREKRPKTFDNWANTIRLMREVDNLTLAEITSVFKWANSDPFWKSNILSPDKLRQQFSRLDAKMRHPPPAFSKPNSANVGAGVQFDPERKSKW